MLREILSKHLRPRLGARLWPLLFALALLAGLIGGTTRGTSTERAARVETANTASNRTDKNNPPSSLPLRATSVMETAAAPALPAQSGGSFSITSSSIAFGGGASAAAPFELDITIGQSIASTSTGGAYTLVSGFGSVFGIEQTCPPISLTPTTLPTGTTGVAYPATTFAATGGTGPYTISLTGMLPAGMNFDNDALAGTPAQSGAFPFTITAVDANNCPGSSGLTLIVVCSANNFSLTPTSKSFDSSGGDGSVDVNAVFNCPWSASSNDGWITLNGSVAGSGAGIINYIVAANAGMARTGTITVADQTFTITQAQASGCTFSINPASQSFTAAAGTGSVAVTAATGCAWTAASNDSFITITSGGSGSGDGTVSYSVSSNAGPARTGTMTIAGKTFTVTQDSGCTFTLGSTSQNFGAAGGTGSVSVASGAGCTWTATSSASFITVTSGGSGSGDGTVSYSVSSNAGPARTGTMTIAGKTFTVTQDSGCTFTLGSTSQNFGAAGGTGSVSVTSGAGCTWTATSSASFITVTSGSGGSGNGTVSYSVASNTGPARTGSMTIAGQAFTVTQQQGPPAIAGFSPASGCPGGTVIISGSALTGTTSVRFNEVAAQFTVTSDSQVSATVPQGAATGPISITTPQGAATSSSSFTVNVVATISGFTPTTGKPGKKVTITGTNLGGATSVTFGGVPATSITNNTSTSLKAAVPPGAVSGRIVVTTPAGCPAISGTDFFAAPSITSVTPASGSPGTTVTISGLNFQGATTVLFKKTPAQFTVVNNTTITATVPAGSKTGVITITTPAGTAKSAFSFTVSP